MPPRVAKKSEKKTSTDEIIEDQAKLLQFVSDSNNDVSALAESPNATTAIMKLLQQLVITNQEVLSKLTKAEEKINNLESKLVHKDAQISELSYRVLKLEQYSRRNTSILTGVKFEENEKLEDKICSIINSTSILPTEFTLGDISHVHRNRVNPKSQKPPSITLQFVRGIDKDRIFRKKKIFRSELGKSGQNINMFHAMSSSLIDMKKRLENFEEVLWVDYYGHITNFVVKLKDGQFIRGVTCAAELEDKVGELTPKTR